MNKNIWTAVIWGYESPPLGNIEPLAMTSAELWNKKEESGYIYFYLISLSRDPLSVAILVSKDQKVKSKYLVQSQLQT